MFSVSHNGHQTQKRSMGRLCFCWAIPVHSVSWVLVCFVCWSFGHENVRVCDRFVFLFSRSASVSAISHSLGSFQKKVKEKTKNIRKKKKKILENKSKKRPMHMIQKTYWKILCSSRSWHRTLASFPVVCISICLFRCLQPTKHRSKSFHLVVTILLLFLFTACYFIFVFLCVCTDFQTEWKTCSDLVFSG